MENGYVKIPVELYDKFKELERKDKEKDKETNQAVIDIIKFVSQIHHLLPESKIHSAADDSGFKVIYTRKRKNDMDLVTEIGKTGKRIHKFTEQY